MKLKSKKVLISSLLLISLFCQAILLKAQQPTNSFTFAEPFEELDERQVLHEMINQAQGAEFSALLEKLFGEDVVNATDSLANDGGYLVESVSTTASEKAVERLEAESEEREEKPAPQPIIAPKAKTTPVKKPVQASPAKKPAAKSPAVKTQKSPTQKSPVKKPIKKTPAKPAVFDLYDQPGVIWRQVAFAFRQISQQDEAPEIKTTESDTEIKAEGSNKKSFETKEAKGTRTQNVETRYLKDGKTFGVEIKDTQVIEAVSKPDGKSYRQELSLTWGAEVAACPDVNGISAGTGKAKVISKTTYTEAGETVTMTSEFDLQAKMTGHVNDQAELKHYNFEVDGYTENSGYEEALKRNLIKEIKIKDGRYGVHFDIPGNTIEVSDGTYGGKRTPAKMGQATAKALTPMSDAEGNLVGSAIGKMVPAIWNSANEMYGAAQRNWRNSGCVEVACTVPKTTLKAGEEIEIAAEAVHLQDKAKLNSQMSAEAYPGELTPESQRATPSATFTFTQEGEDNSYFEVKSVSKRGIGKGEVEFKAAKEKEEATQAGAWTGTISAERKQREEREKRSGSNLAENGGHLQTTTNVQLQLTGRLDRSVEATNAYIATVSGEQEHVDYEYDRYKVDEGYCGPNAVPYKGPKEITRTSTTTINYNKETRVYVEIGGTGGNITFSLPEQNGTTIHKYAHKSPCSDHDRANTSDAKDEDVAGVGGSFAFSFPADPTQKTIKGSTTVREEDGSTTTYKWELERQ